MDILTSTMLDSMSRENQREFQGLLPLLVKKLILNSCKSIDSFRMPHGDDIWAPNFDGVVHCEEESTYVPAGYSVWEFGTNKDSLEKVNEDYKKRTQNSLGVSKKDACFCFVSPKIWAYSKSIDEWQFEHTDWKQVKVYDASILCDWINSEPAVCAWLIEKAFHKPVSFTTLEYAWTQFSNKTSPPFLHSLFISDRDDEVEIFANSLQSPIVRVKADTYVEAVGFVLSAMMQKPEYKETCIVANNEAAYHTINQFVKEKTIILNYPCDHDIDITRGNKIVLCFGKQDVGIEPDINLEPFSKYHYIRAFQDMGISSAEELYYFTHGNIRVLVRRIPGSTVDRKPDWVQREKKDWLAPLLFLRKINRQSEDDKYLVETLSGESFEVVEREYQDLIRMEDSPIKEIENYYVLVNYEEAWNTLHYTVNSPQYTRLTNAIMSLLDAAAQTGNVRGISADSVGRSVTLQYMFTNYVYFALDNPDSDILKQTVQGFLDFFYKPNTSWIITQHLSVLAEASPDIVIRFMQNEMKNDESVLYTLFDVKGYDDKYTYTLFGLDELTFHTVSVVQACKILFWLYQKDYQYKIANTPENSLISALCLINTFVPLTPKQKAELICSFYKEEPRHANQLVLRILDRGSCVVPSRFGRRDLSHRSDITYDEYFDAIESLAKQCFTFAAEQKDAESMIALFQQYHVLRPEFMMHLASLFQQDSFDEDSLARLNYQLRKKKYNIQRFTIKNDKAYIAFFDDLIHKTDDRKIPFRWMFFLYYDCPDESLLPIDDDYFERDNRISEIRKETFNKIFTHNSLPGIYTLLNQMDDSTSWGFFLAANMDEKYHVEIAEKAFESSKIQITAGIVDHSSKKTFDAIYEKAPKEMRKQLFSSMYRTDMDEWLTTEEEKRDFWFGKNMVKYDETVYAKLLKYYPAGLLYYCHETVHNSPTAHLDMVMEIINAIRTSNKETENRSNMEDYELTDTLKIIDQALYTDEWGVFCKNLYVEGFLKEPNVAAVKYLFYHPMDMIRFVEDNYGNYYHVFYHYHLPDCAYKDRKALNHFAESLVQSSHLSLLGSILGRSSKGADGLFPHVVIRDLLEALDNEKLDEDVYIGYLNSRGARTVTDGTNLRHRGIQFMEAARSLAISYPHTASILRDIAEDYMGEARRARLHSELDP